MSDEETDTETKLAILHSLFDTVDQELLLHTLLSCDGDVQQATIQLSGTVSKRSKPDRNITNFASLNWKAAAEKPRRKLEAVLELHTKEQIETSLPCTLIRNVLAADLARRLLESMLEESANWSQGYFKLFDRTVTSPHVAGFYLQSQEDILWHDFYLYNGQQIENIRQFTSEMSQAHKIIESCTRDWLKGRARLHGPNMSNWRANVAFANLYDGRDSAVGYHSDQLTYLGPLPTIASLSLGCEREFRLKPVSSGGTSRTISIRLPHNSLLIMGPGTMFLL